MRVAVGYNFRKLGNKFRVPAWTNRTGSHLNQLAKVAVRMELGNLFCKIYAFMAKRAVDLHTNFLMIFLFKVK